MNWRILFLSLCFWIEENSYFGWNLTADSPEEVICDGIFVLIAALSLLKEKQQ